MSLSLYEIFWLFFLYAFLGWCMEVGYAALNSGKFVNRGFLNGPICPIYGFGVVAVALLLSPLEDCVPLLFFGSVILTSALEFFTGWVLEKIFHTRWWDYSKVPFNIKGYVCLKFSLAWGFAAVFTLKVIHPFLLRCIRSLPTGLGWVLLAVFAVTLAVDVAATVVIVRNLQKRLQILAQLGSGIHGVSDRIGNSLSTTLVSQKEKTQKGMENLSAAGALLQAHRQEEQALAQRHQEEERALREKHRSEEKEALRAFTAEFRRQSSGIKSVHRRVLQAFPDLKMPGLQPTLNRLRRQLEERKKKK